MLEGTAAPSWESGHGREGLLLPAQNIHRDLGRALRLGGRLRVTLLRLHRFILRLRLRAAAAAAAASAPAGGGRLVGTLTLLRALAPLGLLRLLRNELLRRKTWKY